MTTRKVLLSAFMSIMLFIILLSVFGQSGILVNRSLSARLDELSRQEEERRLEIEALEERRRQVSSEAYFDDVALSLGYEREGDVVYYFEEPDVLEDADTMSDSAEDEEPLEVWKGVETWILASVSAGCGLLLFIVISIVGAHGGGRRGDADNRDARRRHDEFDWS